MSMNTLSLIAVVCGFSALVLWVYWPSNKERLEARGRLPLEEGGPIVDEPDKGNKR